MPKRVLAATFHDPAGRLAAQSTRMLPLLRAQYDALVVLATATTQPSSLDLLRQADVVVAVQSADAPLGLPQIGRSRREAVALALDARAEWVHLCDWDRALHWAEYYPDELARVAHLLDYDFVVHGRSQRAFLSHPQAQVETEAIINRVFALVSGLPWDVGAASRGLARHAADAILRHSDDDTVGTDASWPLLLRRLGGFRLGHLATEGLEYETADRFADEVAAAGGRDAWLAQIDADPCEWTLRTELALLEARAALRFLGEATA
jgi:diadenosine tetraphosphatase ApaH/serine/threonine PP2A family protein phosphatase